MTARLTYAQKKLQDLLKERNLKAWCIKNNLSHPNMYRLAVGEAVPTYAIMCRLLPLIPIVDWIYFEDEEIPYAYSCLPEWNPEDIPYFVRIHKHDYKQVAADYEITEAYARNLFVNHRARPSVMLIRKAADKGIDPSQFFIAGELSDDGKFYPERGDVVSISGKTMLVLSRYEQNKTNHSFTGIGYENDDIDFNSFETITYVRNIPKLVKKAETGVLEQVLQQVRKIFE